MLSKKDQVVSRHPRRMQKMPSQFVQFPVVAYIWQPAINDVFAMAGALETMRQQQHNRRPKEETNNNKWEEAKSTSVGPGTGLVHAAGV